MAKTKTFKMEPQQLNQWCWSAVAVSVTNYFRASGPHLTQCELAATITGVSGGCGTSSQPNPACDQAESLTAVLSSLHRLAAVPIPRPLQFTEIRQAIDAGFPIPVRIVWDDDQDTAHFVVISGYLQAGSALVQVDDPYYGRSVMDYDAFVSAYRQVGQWERTYPVSGGQ